jgi:hypothetical protein
MLPAFAAAFNYLLYEKPLSFDNTLARENKNSFLAKSSFFKKSRLLLFGLFILLLTNFFTFNYYFNQKKELQTSVNGYGILLNSMDSLKKEYNQRKILIDSLGLSLKSQTSFYCDQLAYDMPNEIILSRLQLNPPAQKSNNNEWSVDNNKIILEGTTANSAVLNQWMKLLKQKKFINQITLEKYNQESSSHPGTFALNLQLK